MDFRSAPECDLNVADGFAIFYRTRASMWNLPARPPPAEAESIRAVQNRWRRSVEVAADPVSHSTVLPRAVTILLKQYRNGPLRSDRSRIEA
jgi:hypothetical protein